MQTSNHGTKHTLTYLFCCFCVVFWFVFFSFLNSLFDILQCNVIGVMFANSSRSLVPITFAIWCHSCTSPAWLVQALEFTIHDYPYEGDDGDGRGEIIRGWGRKTKRKKKQEEQIKSNEQEKRILVKVGNKLLFIILTRNIQHPLE